MAEKLFEVEHKGGEELVLRFKCPGLSFMPESARGHFRKSGKEMLLALRNLIDLAIEQVEKTEKTRTKKRTKIEVQ